MKLLIDHDGVLCGWSERIVSMFNERHGTSHDHRLLNSWRIQDMLGLENEDEIFEFMNHPEFYDGVRPTDGAVDSMQELVSLGHDVIIVTAVPWSAPNSYGGKIRWFRKHMPFISMRNISSMSRKEEHGGDLLLDDAPHNIKRFAATCRPAVVYDALYNRDVESSWRVKSMPEFVKLVKEFSS